MPDFLTPSTASRVSAYGSPSLRAKASHIVIPLDSHDAGSAAGWCIKRQIAGQMETSSLRCRQGCFGVEKQPLSTRRNYGDL